MPLRAYALCIIAGILVAVWLTLSDPARFAEADRYGGCVVGAIVIFAGLRVSRETSLQLMDTMPGDTMIDQIRSAAKTVPGVRGVEKCFARKTGLKYHVDLHLEVDPEMTVRRSHDLAHDVRLRIVERLPWVAARVGLRGRQWVSVLDFWHAAHHVGLALATLSFCASRARV